MKNCQRKKMFWYMFAADKTLIIEYKQIQKAQDEEP